MRVPFAVFALAILCSQGAVAQTACGVGGSGATYTQVHMGANNQIIWCADPTFWSQNSASVTPFFAYYDAVLPVIAQDFNVTAQGPFFIAVDPPNGGASTPTPFGQGVNISGDSFAASAFNVPGFWGYLLGTHEFVNQFTSILGGGWPNDWWADHRSPFPNAMDPIVLAQMGKTAAAQAQFNRFIPGGDSADPEVVMFTDLFNTYGGWPYFQKTFGLLRGDGMRWDDLRDPPNFQTQTPFVSGNPSAMLSNYIVAYFSLAAGVDTSSRFSQAVGIGLQPPNWPSDQTFTAYNVDSTAVGTIADAHCALQAAQATRPNPSANAQKALDAYHQGDYNNVASTLGGAAACGANCPSECGCHSADNRCVAKWHADAASNPNGTGSTSSTDTGGNSGAEGSPSAPVPGALGASVSNTTGTCASSGPQAWIIFGTTLGILWVLRRRSGRG